MAGGYMGKYCVIDLTDSTIETVVPDDHFYRKYLSGYGLGAAVITERQQAGIDPLSASSYLGICSGLLTGSGASFSGRFMVVGKSPLTGGWGDANAGGYLSREIKRTGYDAIFVTGKARSPVWLFITEEKIIFNNAVEIWGSDIVATEASIKQHLGNKKVQIASIGQAGEKLSLISGIATAEGRIAARSGLGAVMGSKNLKAIAFYGRRNIPIFDVKKVKTITRAFLKDYRISKRGDRLTAKLLGVFSKIIARTGINAASTSSTVREIYKTFGTSGLNVYAAMVGDSPIKNWKGVGYTDYGYENVSRISGENLAKTQKKKYACQNCPLGCGGLVGIQQGTFRNTIGHKPEYETCGAFGGLLLNADRDSIIECNELCNRAAIDTISLGGVIAFAIECFENNLINEQITGGLKLGWGKADEIVALTRLIIEREGFGDLLADGVKRAAKSIGKGSEMYAIQAGGQELPMHDSRYDAGLAVAYQCEPTPGRHTISSFLYANLFGIADTFPALKGMKTKAKGKDEKDINLYTGCSYYMQVINGCGVCQFGPLTALFPLVEYINAVTGWNRSADDYLKTGERILNLRKAFNIREGLRAEDSKIHPRAIGNPPLTKGPLKGKTIEMDNLERLFYKTAGWEPSIGGPRLQKLKELELDHLFAAPEI